MNILKKGSLSSGTFELSLPYMEKVKKESNYYTVLKKEYIPVFYSESKKHPGLGIKKRIKEDTETAKFKMNWAQVVGFAPEETLIILGELNKYFDLDNINNVPINRQDKLDVFVGLHNYTVNAEIEMLLEPNNLSSVRVATDNKITIKTYLGSIISWKSVFIDYYDFNQNVGFTLPNPDYTGNKSSHGKIHPELKKVRFDELKHSALVEMPQTGL